ncbi:hypothetical protein HPB50_014436 [Hyalomma asiaticum]|uniref:Uncharacterized protein n=1 Tax=Hyalomma asiaticum TaxID=266040 RepID=A0ACB7SF59_HYAAI|nr:hypothetical protein HPB50_014436 [Hyalomma asiaticum]
MCRIFKSEACRQVRFYTDCLQVVNQNELPLHIAQKRFPQGMRLASQTADFLWGNVVVRLPRRGRRIPGQGQEVTVLGDAVIPENVASLLKLGPKFCEHPDLDKTELLGVVRTAAGRASTDELDRCIREGVDCLPQRVKKGNTARQRTTVAVLREAGLKLLVSDKEGGFVVMPSGLYKDKADAAILNNFKELQGVPPAKLRSRLPSGVTKVPSQFLGKWWIVRATASVFHQGEKCTHIMVNRKAQRLYNVTAQYSVPGGPAKEGTADRFRASG